MSVEMDRRLRDLAPRMQRLDELRAERARQHAELAAAEELLKQLKWTSYQAEAEFRKAEEGGGFFSGLFGGKANNDELLLAAQEAREVYQASKEKVKPLRDELANLEREIADLEAAKPEYEAALEARARAAAVAAGASGSQVQALQETMRATAGLEERCGQLTKKGRALESNLGRCDRSTLFTLRAEMTAFQKELCVFILEANGLPAAWSLPPLPLEADVGNLDPIGVGSKMHLPESRPQEMLVEAAVFGHMGMHGDASRMRAIINAGHASDDSVRSEARFQSILVGEWTKRLAAFGDGLRRVRAELQQQLQALLLTPATPAPVSQAAES